MLEICAPSPERRSSFSSTLYRTPDLIRWEHLDTAVVPGDGGSLRLMRRGGEYSIMAGPIELMNSRLAGSEALLASLGVEKLERSDPAVLIGGLGMGFTLRAALAALGPQASVTVAELVPAVIVWARGPLADIFQGCVDDPRVFVCEADVVALIREQPAAWDAILLDVDNGPGGLTREANDALYDARGLAAAKAALRPGGVLAVWSSTQNTAFTRRLIAAGFAVEEIPVRARGNRGGARHLIWRATKRR